MAFCSTYQIYLVLLSLLNSQVLQVHTLGANKYILNEFSRILLRKRS